MRNKKKLSLFSAFSFVAQRLKTESCMALLIQLVLPLEKKNLHILVCQFSSSVASLRDLSFLISFSPLPNTLPLASNRTPSSLPSLSLHLSFIVGSSSPFHSATP